MTDRYSSLTVVLEGEAEAWQDTEDEDQKQHVARMLQVAEQLRELVRTKPQW